MPAPDSARKLLSLATIGIVFGVSAWLRPSPDPVRRPELLPARALPLLDAPRSGLVQSRFRVDSERVQSAFRVGSEWGGGATQVAGMSEEQEVRTVVDVIAAEPLAARTLVLPLDSAPGVGIDQPAPIRNPVANAMITASRQTGDAFRTGAAETAGAFRTASRALRSIF